MTTKVLFLIRVIIMLVLTGTLSAGVSVVRNPSFEADGQVSNIAQSGLSDWCEVSVPAGKFAGNIAQDWFSHSYYDGDGNSLFFNSVSNTTFTAGQMATVSQPVYLADVNEIIFDLKVTGTHGAFPWNSNNFVAVMLVDGNEVWNSSVLTPTGNAVHNNVRYQVDEFYKDQNMHILSVGMKAASAFKPITQYKMWVDFVKFDTHCGGFGYLDGDINHDCYVNAEDLELLAQLWLTDDPNYHGLHDRDSVIDMRDYSLLAAGWLDNSRWENWGQDNCYISELVPYDIDDSGIVGVDDIVEMGSQWLGGGSCARADLNGDGIVNFIDYAILFEQWGRKSWLYGL